MQRPSETFRVRDFILICIISKKMKVNIIIGEFSLASIKFLKTLFFSRRSWEEEFDIWRNSEHTNWTVQNGFKRSKTSHRMLLLMRCTESTWNCNKQGKCEEDGSLPDWFVSSSTRRDPGCPRILHTVYSQTHSTFLPSAPTRMSAVEIYL